MKIYSMKNDPCYLSEEASLGVLSVAGNLYESIITKIDSKKKNG